MTLNLLRTGVGVHDFDHLVSMMKERNFIHQGQKARIITTRYRPKDYPTILETSGSIYWIIKGVISARQAIIDFNIETEDTGKSFCQIILSPDVVRTQGYPHRAIQGWRYLKEDKTPPDLKEGETGTGDLPPDMIKELRELGLV